MERSNENSVSLNKYLSGTGICSRREADQWIKAARVTINGETAQSGNRVFPGDLVLLDGNPLVPKPPTLYIAFNKPVGIVSTTDPKEPKNIIYFINHPERLFPIGRLDKPSQGLIFLTNDGDIVNKILRAGNRHEKEYIVRVDRPISAEFIQRMSRGIPILDTVTKPCEVQRVSRFVFKIILVQGLNRQIRRMCEYLNYEVVALKRVRIMTLTLGDLPTGQWRHLTREEVAKLQESLTDSDNTPYSSSDLDQDFN